MSINMWLLVLWLLPPPTYTISSESHRPSDGLVVWEGAVSRNKPIHKS